MEVIGKDRVAVGKLGFRAEGQWWKAYYVKDDDMRDSIELARIRLSVIQKLPGMRESFVKLMEDVIVATFKETLGREPEVAHTTKAPTHKGGHA